VITDQFSILDTPAEQRLVVSLMFSQVGLVAVENVGLWDASSYPLIPVKKVIHNLLGKLRPGSLDKICCPHSQPRMALQVSFHEVRSRLVVNKPGGSALAIEVSLDEVAQIP
jgi:hypothetical protein